MIRKDATRVDLANGGLILFLYDDSNRENILGSKAELLEGFRGAATELEDPILRSLAEDGLLLAIELIQDDDVHLEIVTGRALTKRERVAGRLQDALQSVIALPSGRLCLETYDSLRIGPETPEGRGVEVRVKPGRYVISFHRDETDAGDANPDVIVLTEATPQNRPDSVPAMLTAGVIGGPDSSTGNFTIEGGVFRGLIRTWEGAAAYEVNIDRSAATRLGIVAGSTFHIAVREPPFELYGTFLGETVAQATQTQDRLAGKQPPQPHARCQWLGHLGHEVGETLLCELGDGFVDLGPDWRPATLRLTTW